ncbi:hypothetical protein HDR59_05455 [bacterium]|nr:hypothetical protein [bacterium]
MEIKPDILDTCTLLQACEWIAFGWEPMEEIWERHINRIRPELLDYKKSKEIYEKNNKNNYSYLIYIAASKLKIHLLKGYIKAKGRFYTSIFDCDDISFTMSGKSRELTNVENLTSCLDIDIKSSIIYTNRKSTLPGGGGNAYYIDAQISFEELKKVFPYNESTNKEENTNESTPTAYTTIYLDLMKKIIKQENITAENQLKKDYLKKIFNEELKKSGYESNKLADAMATLIRLPESQRGKRKSKK